MRVVYSSKWVELKNTIATYFPFIKKWFEYKLLTAILEKAFYLIFHFNKSTKGTFYTLNMWKTIYRPPGKECA